MYLKKNMEEKAARPHVWIVKLMHAKASQNENQYSKIATLRCQSSSLKREGDAISCQWFVLVRSASALQERLRGVPVEYKPGLHESHTQRGADVAAK